MKYTAPKEFSFFLMRDNLRDYSDNCQILNNSYPFVVNLNSRIFSIYVNTTHDSGYGRKNDDECRIQIQRSHWDLAQSNSSIFFLGYYSASNMYSIWEPELIKNRQDPSTFSIYSRFSKLDEAARSGYSTFSFHSRILGKRTFCLNFYPDKIGDVLNSVDMIWELGEGHLDSIFNRGENTKEVGAPGDISGANEHAKQKISVTSEKYKRDPKFKLNVLKAYNDRCAVCSIQMGIIEAAHIIPHSHDLGTDNVQNGIALCPNHHRMFDSGLIGLSESYMVLVNYKRIEYLKHFKLSKGTDDLTRIHNSEIKLPIDSQLIPSTENIKIANKIRGVYWD